MPRHIATGGQPYSDSSCFLNLHEIDTFTSGVQSVKDKNIRIKPLKFVYVENGSMKLVLVSDHEALLVSGN